MKKKQRLKVTSKKRYSEKIRGEALRQRIEGKTYQEVSVEVGVPEDTLRKWFAPSVNRHNLANIQEQHFKELRKSSQRILEANIVSVAEKLTEMAMEGNIRAIVEVLERVHGISIKKQELEEDKVKEFKINFVDFSGSSKKEDNTSVK